MRVAHVSAAMAHGGAERVLVDLACAHARAGLEVSIVAPRGALDRDWAALGVTRIPVPAAGRGAGELVVTAVAVNRALDRIAPDVVHAHNVKATGLAIASALGPYRAVRVPILTTLHGVADAEMRTSVRIIRFSAMTVAVSEAVRDDAVAHGLDPDRARVIHNGVSPAAPLDAARRAGYVEELQLRGDVVAAVGRLAPQKAFDRFLDAAARVLEARPDTTFLLVGDGPMRAQLERRAAALGIADSVRFAGMREDARALIDVAELLVFSSDWEGLSIAALEALAAGTPVVAPDVPGMRELLASGAGAVVFDATPASLADEITRLLEDRDRRAEMGRIGRGLIEAEFSATAMREAYLDAYRTLVR